MTDGTLQLDALNEQNLQVMQAYAAQATAARAAAKAVAKAADSEASDEGGFDGWLERMSSLTGFTAEQLTQQHGQLIAQGFLKFEIAGRSVGLRYQISPRGRQAMDRALAKSAEVPDDNSEDENSGESDPEHIAPVPARAASAPESLADAA